MELTAEALQPHVGEDFAVSVVEGEEPTLTVKLSDIRLHPRAPAGLPKAPFSIYFTGPASIPMDQGTFWFSHDALGSLPIFVVPIRGDSGTRTYEAVFN